MKKIVLVAFDRFTDIDLFLMWDILRPQHAGLARPNSGGQRCVRVGAWPACFGARSAQRGQQCRRGIVRQWQGGHTRCTCRPRLPCRRVELDAGRQRIGSLCAGAFILERLGCSAARRTTHPDARSACRPWGLNSWTSRLCARATLRPRADACRRFIWWDGWLNPGSMPTSAVRRCCPVLPTGRQALYDALIGLSIRQGAVGASQQQTRHGTSSNW